MAVSGRTQGPPQDGDVEQYSKQLGQWVLTNTIGGQLNFGDLGAVRGQIVSVSGDLWFLSNAIWNPNDTTPTGNFYRIDRTHAAFGFQMQGQGYIPGEPNLGYYVAGATIWVAQPEGYDVIRGGGQFQNPIFNVVGGWELGSTVTQQRQMTIGGGGIEIDGYSLTPYGRVINNQTGTVLHKQLVGMARNAFTDLSGYDDSTQESWYWGFVQDYNTSTFLPVPGSSRWSVVYLPPNTSPFSGIFYEYLKVTPNTAVATVEVTQNPTTPLGVATKQYVDSRVVATIIGPGSTVDASGFVAVVSLPANLVAGRRYRVTAQVIGQQITAIGSPYLYIADTGGLVSGNARVLNQPSVPINAVVSGSCTWYIVAASTATDTFSIQASSSAGAWRTTANSMQLTVEDVGI